MERAIALATGDVIELEDLPPGIGGDYGEILLPSFKRNDTLRMWAGRYARLMLERCQGNKRETARVLAISYHTLVAYLKGSEGQAGLAEGGLASMTDGEASEEAAETLS